MNQVTKNMTIGDVVAKYPEAAAILTKHGLHCVGCGASKFETVEQGYLGHGKDEAGLQIMLDEVNAYIEKLEESEVEGDYPVKTSGISLTASAVTQVTKLMGNESASGGLRINLLPGGCSGFMYSMNFEDTPRGDDTVFESNGVKIFIRNDYVEYLNGTAIDFVNTLNESGFVFNNPNAKSTCGCGKSFG